MVVAHHRLASAVSVQAVLMSACTRCVRVRACVCVCAYVRVCVCACVCDYCSHNSLRMYYN